MFRLLMAPANAVCDAMRITDENERGVIRMLINMLIWTVVGVIAATFVIASL